MRLYCKFSMIYPWVIRELFLDGICSCMFLVLEITPLFGWILFSCLFNFIISSCVDVVLNYECWCALLEYSWMGVTFPMIYYVSLITHSYINPLAHLSRSYIWAFKLLMGGENCLWLTHWLSLSCSTHCLTINNGHSHCSDLYVLWAAD